MKLQPLWKDLVAVLLSASLVLASTPVCSFAEEPALEPEEAAVGQVESSDETTPSADEDLEVTVIDVEDEDLTESEGDELAETSGDMTSATDELPQEDEYDLADPEPEPDSDDAPDTTPASETLDVDSQPEETVEDEEPLRADSDYVVVSYVPASPITFVLGSVEWDSWDSCYLYQYNPCNGDKITVRKGSSTTTYTYDGTKYVWKDQAGKSDWMEVQLYARLSAAQNTLGTHALMVDYFRNSSFEARGSVTFTLVESPLASISYSPANPIVLVKGVDSSSYYEYDKATKKGHTYHHYFFPTGSRLMGDVLTLTLEDGSAKRYVYKGFKNPEYGYDEYGYVNDANAKDIIRLDDLTISADQSYAKRWGSGSHAFTLNYQGRTTQVPVTVKAKTVTKVSYTPKKQIRRSTTDAIAYTKKLGIFDASYANKYPRYHIIFQAPVPQTGDVLKVTEGGKSTSYTYDASKRAFVRGSASIPLRDVTIQALDVDPDVKTAAFPCIYQGVTCGIPFKVTKKAQKVKAKAKKVVVGKKVSINAKSTGFADANFSYKSSDKRIATVNKWGVVKGRKVGTVKITIKAKSNVAYKTSKAKVIKVKVGKRNPMKVKAKKTVKVKHGKKARPVTVSKAKGAVAYSNASTNKTAKTFKVSKKTGRIRVPKKTKKGTYTLKMKVKAKGKGVYLARTKTVKVRIKVT